MLLDSTADVSLEVDGNGQADAYRTGAGNGNVTRKGSGHGDAVRTGAGHGEGRAGRTAGTATPTVTAPGTATLCGRVAAKATRHATTTAQATHCAWPVAPDTRFGSGRATVTQSGQEPEQAMRSGDGEGTRRREEVQHRGRERESAGNRQGDRRPRPAWRRHGVPEHEHRMNRAPMNRQRPGSRDPPRHNEPQEPTPGHPKEGLQAHHPARETAMVCSRQDRRIGCCEAAR